MTLSDKELYEVDPGECPICGCEICQCDDEGEPYIDCHMDRQGNCGKAGSEECDFECPNRNVKRN